MARSEQPLLARPSSPNSANSDIEEEDALLTGQPVQRPESTASKTRKWREAGLFVWALLATVAVIILAVVYQHESSIAHSKPKRTGGWGPDGKPSGKRNMIFMVSDGMGPTSLSLTRSWRQYVDSLPIDDILVLDKHLIGSSRTRSSNSLVTDSAAGATAFSCGLKSYNGAISVLADHSPCGTVLEAAKRAGYMTGLVVTTRITDATPACFAAHANRREYEDLIAEQMVGNYPLGRVVDLLIGGGRCHFLPNSTEGSCRADATDVVRMAKEDFGFQYINNRTEFDKLTHKKPVDLPLLALLADTDIPYEIDRAQMADIYPSQAEMARLALKALSAATKDSEKGFFLMIEGSRIDHAGHANDPAAQVHEVMAHDEAFAAVLKFLEEDDTDGILVSTSDHETGGLATARQLHKTYPEYLWHPGVLAKANHSTEYLAREWSKYLSSSSSTSSRKDKSTKLADLIESGLGITDYTPEELDAIIDAEPIWPPAYHFADLISRRAQIGWSTHGHSAVDVNIYASSPDHAPGLVGNHENTEVGQFIAEYLDLTHHLDEVTKELREKKVKTSTTTDGGSGEEKGEAKEWGEWMGPPALPDDEIDDKLVSLDDYHGDFKHRKREAEADCGCGMRH
ncbi:Repressible alkaline phosphatase [Exophiala dermatitidis]|uniref:Alkaline phosphatase n=1 Tax=Exophiala dermatitidis (strain ATCC 34100 / CBS 525.76 / NIH/UT8656) TaxID=858893 RepID=H6BZ09_EXODN|nr:alkaline phosphatase [Exophiala dermatitidis NIH/UT8656]EHY56872.1 alkaline phosphatase [Exophiala dermatitidis NIH/UT8656]